MPGLQLFDVADTPAFRQVLITGNAQLSYTQPHLTHPFSPPPPPPTPLTQLSPKQYHDGVEREDVRTSGGSPAAEPGSGVDPPGLWPGTPALDVASSGLARAENLARETGHQ